MPGRNDNRQEQPATVGAVARHLGCAEATVRRMADAGQIPCVRDSAGRRVFDLNAVTRSLSARSK